jgi:hypothetical protein
MKTGLNEDGDDDDDDENEDHKEKETEKVTTNYPNFKLF